MAVFPTPAISSAKALLRIGIVFCALLTLIFSPDQANAQAIPPSLVGVTEWSGTITQNPPAPGFTSGIWNVHTYSSMR